jgi:hypothetical protein
MTKVENSDGSNADVAESLRIPRWLVAFGFGIPLALILFAASPLGNNFFYVMLGIPALLLVWVIVGTISLMLCIRSAMRRAWKRSFITLILPIILVSVAVNPFGFVRSCNYLGDVAHFIVSKPYYDRIIAALPANQRPHLTVFNWGGMVWASQGLVYDETDQVSLPRGRQSAAWLAQARHSELSCEGYGVQPLWDHYYLASFPC